MYTAVVLTPESHSKLMGKFESAIPEDWAIKAHHMTCNMGDAANGPAKDFVGKTVQIKVVSIAKGDKVMALGVECEVPSSNAIKHVTLAVNEKAGGKAVMSNKLEEWTPIPEFTLEGTVRECR